MTSAAAEQGCAQTACPEWRVASASVGARSASSARSRALRPAPGPASRHSLTSPRHAWPGLVSARLTQPFAAAARLGVRRRLRCASITHISAGRGNKVNLLRYLRSQRRSDGSGCKSRGE